MIRLENRAIPEGDRALTFRELASVMEYRNIGCVNTAQNGSWTSSSSAELFSSLSAVSSGSLNYIDKLLRPLTGVESDTPQT